MRDEVAKKERGYKDPRSKVRPDGSEILYGKDWTQRKKDLWVRCDGRCEKLVWKEGQLVTQEEHWERCRTEAHDPDHKIKRSRKRDDRLDNLEALCRLHHDLKHPEKNRLHWSKR